MTSAHASAQPVEPLGSQQPAADLDHQRAGAQSRPSTDSATAAATSPPLPASVKPGASSEWTGRPQRVAAARARKAPDADGNHGDARGQARGDAAQAPRRSTPPAPPRRRRRSPPGRRRRAARGRRTPRAPAESGPRRATCRDRRGTSRCTARGTGCPAAGARRRRSRTARRSPGRAGRRSARARAPRRCWSAARRCRPARLRAAARGRCGPRAATAPAGDRDHVGGRAAAVQQDRVGQRARDQQRRRHPVGGRAAPAARLAPRPGSTSSPPVVITRSRRPGSACSRGLEHVQHSLSLAGEHVDELGGRGQRHRRAVEPEPPDDVGDHVGHGLGVAPHLERLGDDPDLPVIVHHRRLGVGAADVEPDHG